jgi:hypothetical protein
MAWLRFVGPAPCFLLFEASRAPRAESPRHELEEGFLCVRIHLENVNMAFECSIGLGEGRQ